MASFRLWGQPFERTAKSRHAGLRFETRLMSVQGTWIRQRQESRRIFLYNSTSGHGTCFAAAWINSFDDDLGTHTIFVGSGQAMNPRDELLSLTDLFPEPEALFLGAEHIPSAVTPEPYKTMLVHDHHMTVAMETHHGCAVDVRVIDSKLNGNEYARKILLLKHGTLSVVQFGIVRFHLEYVTQAVREQIIAGQIPLGRILINHNVLRNIDLGAILEITAGPGLATYLPMPVGAVTYGRLATIFCNRLPAVDLLEISAPLV